MKTLKLLSLFLSLLCAQSIYAHDFEVDGVYYNITSNNYWSYEVQVTTDGSSTCYSGNLYIYNQYVRYNGIDYYITDIDASNLRDCNRLENIYIDNEYLTSIDGIVYDSNKTSLKYCPAGKSGTISIPESVTSIGDYAFYNCSALTNINIPSSVTSIGRDAFYGCSALTNINIPSSVTSIGSSAFEGCSALTSIVVDKNNTKYDSRNDCNAIIETATNTLIQGFNTTIIPEGVTSIGSSAFYGCSNLKVVTSSETPASIKSNSFYNVSIIYVPATALETYRTAWSDFANIILSEDCIGYADQNVTLEAESSLSALHKTIGEKYLEGVFNLKISGTINSYDIMIIRNKMRQLRTLDLSDATIVYNSYEYYTGCHSRNNEVGSYFLASNSKIDTLWLPNNATTIANNAFRSVTSLKKVVVGDSVTSIGNYAFYCCYGLEEIDLGDNNLTSIGSYAFSNCYGLEEIDLGDNLITINSYAFNNCSRLKEFEFPNSLTTISDHAFFNCSNLKKVKFGNQLQTIGDYAFSGDYSDDLCPIDTLIFPKSVKTIGTKAFSTVYYRNESLKYISFAEGSQTTIEEHAFNKCDSLKEVNFPKNSIASLREYAFYNCYNLEKADLPMGLEKIYEFAFYGCSNLKEIQIPSSVTTIADNAFGNSSSVQKVYTYTLEPTPIAQNTFSCYSSATLYVPRFSYYNYYYDTQWSQFLNLVEFDADSEKNDYYINSDFTLDEERIQNNPDITVNGEAGLIVEGDNVQQLEDLVVNGNGNTGAGGSVIAGENLTADRLTIQISVTGSRWYFFCFPFDIPLAAVECSGNHVFRYYDGEERAKNGSGGWKNVTNEKLSKGKGYIFQCSSSGTLSITLENIAFDDSDVLSKLNSWAATAAYDASWNLVGNPYMSYYNIQDMGYSAPITIWNVSSRTYTAYSAQDDEYYLSPYQAFFVQKPEDVEALTFRADKRITKQQIDALAAAEKPGARRVAADTGRRLINITLGDGTMSDRTRVVFNDEKELGYEMDCDAAKFISDEASVQLYTLDHELVRYAINERPGSPSEVQLGFVVRKQGEYTLSAPRMDVPMSLYDKVTGRTFDLSMGDYHFTSEAGTHDDRFTLFMSQSETGIDHLLSETGVQVAAGEGALHFSGVAGHTVVLYNAGGVRVAEITADGSVAVTAGTYVVSVGSVTGKVIVK